MTTSATKHTRPSTQPVEGHAVVCDQRYTADGRRVWNDDERQVISELLNRSEPYVVSPAKGRTR